MFQLLKSLFLEEWGVVLNLKASAEVEFKFNASFLGEQTIRAYANVDTHVLASVGGMVKLLKIK